MLKFVPSPETFVVEEIAAYEPSGEGEHTFLWIEKRGLTTIDAVKRIARALDADSRDIGYAGLKDRNAVTRQWISVPRVEPERALELREDGISVLIAKKHGNKLRTGHLRGNRFEVVLTGSADDVAQAGARLAALAAGGVPNRFGEQRFGAAGDNAAAGLAILRGERRERDHRLRKLLLSAAQSAVFNRTLELRAAAPGGLRAVLAGDVLQKVASGGLFITEDVSVDQARVDAGELAITGPMPGGREKEPPPGTPARAVEDEALLAVGATREDFGRAGRDLPGARRPFLVPLDLGEPAVQGLAAEGREGVVAGREGAEVSRGGQPEPARASPDEAAVRLRFTLPSGSYATVVVAALSPAADA